MSMAVSLTVPLRFSHSFAVNVEMQIRGALHPLHSGSPRAHGSSEHKHVSDQGKYLERRITDAESLGVDLEFRVLKGHVIVPRRFSEVKDSLSVTLFPSCCLSVCPLCTSTSHTALFFQHLKEPPSRSLQEVNTVHVEPESINSALCRLKPSHRKIGHDLGKGTLHVRFIS